MIWDGYRWSCIQRRFRIFNDIIIIVTFAFISAAINFWFYSVVAVIITIRVFFVFCTRASIQNASTILIDIYKNFDVSGNTSDTYLCIHIMHVVHHIVDFPFRYSPFTFDLIPILSHEPVHCTRYRKSLVINGWRTSSRIARAIAVASHQANQLTLRIHLL